MKDLDDVGQVNEEIVLLRDFCLGPKASLLNCILSFRVRMFSNTPTCICSKIFIMFAYKQNPASVTQLYSFHY